jgi:hypothetical protein
MKFWRTVPDALIALLLYGFSGDLYSCGFAELLYTPILNTVRGQKRRAKRKKKIKRQR